MMVTDIVNIEIDMISDEDRHTRNPLGEYGVIPRVEMKTTRVEDRVERGGIIGTEHETEITDTEAEREIATECIDEMIQDLDTQGATLDKPLSSLCPTLSHY
jgi:hypothetical protein